MKSKFMHVAFLSIGLLFVNFSFSETYAQTADSKMAKVNVVTYTCPMHLDVVKDLPGKCPKCGMALEKKKDMKKDKHAHDSSMMKHDNMKHDSVSAKKELKMMNDTISREKGKM